MADENMAMLKESEVKENAFEYFLLVVFIIFLLLLIIFLITEGFPLL